MHQGKMLARNLPKRGSCLVNPPPKFNGIELQIQVHELRLGWYRNVLAAEDTRVRCLGWIIPFAGLVANVFLGNQFERRLKEVDVKS